jgi:hypothetical protein
MYPDGLGTRSTRNFPRNLIARKRRSPICVSTWGIGPGMWAAYLGDPQLALELIRPVAMDSKFTPIVWLPFFSDMRRLPEFKALVIELKLDEYWRTTGKWGEFCKPAGANDFDCRRKVRGERRTSSGSYGYVTS